VILSSWALPPGEYRVEKDFPKIGRRVFNVQARRLYQQSKGTHYIIVRFEEVKG
jgi:hypothetical protein